MRYPPDWITFEDVVTKERAALGLDADDDVTALCLSGGGIRSAAFSLGCVQALASRKLLGKFNYLSTVSGGGYIGGWLTRALQDEGGNVEEFETKLGDAETGRHLIARLRTHANYLTPQPGIFSSDTWQGALLWLRNTAINWCFFAPLMISLAIVALLYVNLVWWCSEGSDTLLAWKLLGAGAIYATGAFFICTGLPSFSHPFFPLSTNATELGPDRAKISLRIILPGLIWAFVLPLLEAPSLRLPGAEAGFHEVFAPPVSASSSERLQRKLYSGDDMEIVLRTTGAARPVAVATADATPRRAPGTAIYGPTICVFAASVLAYVIAWALTAWRRRDADKANSLRDLVAWSGASLVSAALLVLGIRLATGLGIVTFALVAPAWIVASDLFRMTVYVAFRKDGLWSDLDREWLARLSADRLKWTAMLTLLSLGAVLVPIELRRHGDATWVWLLGVAGLVPGPASAILGRSVLTRVVDQTGLISGRRIELFAKFAALIFIFSLLCASGWMVASALGAQLPPRPPRCAPFVRLLAMLGACVLVLVGVDRCIDFNLFSMHSTYRNRLIRAFLGTAVCPKRRRQDAYTSFAAQDNIRMQDCLKPGADETEKHMLYPVLGVALNCTSETARGQRKAVPFTITPLHCGSSALDRYWPTADYYQTPEKLGGPFETARGITLGTAMALSGAAVSPNMGYASSPLLALVMTLFNARLGAWYPNPAYEKPSGRWRPRFSRAGNAISLFQELRGRSAANSPLVYLSDGGHFDSLGLYEMLRRRCRLILAIDATHDEDYDCAELGRTLERARTDLGVHIEFSKTLRVGDTKTQSRLARGEIFYPLDKKRSLPASTGRLLYLKPWVPDDAPAEVRAYDRQHPEFPHRPSFQQFYEESDFENYRLLGEHLVTKLPTRRFACGAGNLADLIF